MSLEPSRSNTRVAENPGLLIYWTGSYIMDEHAALGTLSNENIQWQWFARFARKHRIPDTQLCDAVSSANTGGADADYGGGVIKQRIARIGEGKSAGYRTVILFRRDSLAFFVFGFAKSGQSNIDSGDVAAFKLLAARMLSASDADISTLVTNGDFLEVNHVTQE